VKGLDVRQSGIRPLMQGMRLVWHGARGWTAARLAIMAVQGLVPLAALYLIKLIIDAVSAEIAAPGTGGGFEPVVLLIVAAGLVAMFGAALRSASTLIGEVQAQLVTDSVYGLLQRKSIAVDLEYYENPEYHNTLHRAQEEAPFRPTRIVNSVANFIQNVVSLLAVLGLLISFHWVIAPVLLVAAIPGALVRVRFSRRAYHWQLKETGNHRKVRYFNRVLTSAENAKELRLFGLGEHLMKRFRDLNRRLRRERVQLAARRSVADLLAQTLAAAAVFGAFALIARAALDGRVSIGDMVMFFGAIQRGQDFFRDALQALASLYEDNLFLTDMDTFLRLEPNVREPEQPVPPPTPIRSGITITNLSFRYPGSTRTVLEDVSLTIRPGEHIALVGENGSGKTTLVKLLCRLYDPAGGSIAVDGIDLRSFRAEDWRRQISVIFQDYVRYHLTAQENIWFGDVGRPADAERIREAARRTGADEVIERLTHSYQTYLGKQFEDGAELSGGEWQKVALARAFLRSTPILVMDEPSAALDARAEYEVFRQFHELAAGRTAILISHRLSTVRMADCIYVLEDGRLIESGQHDQLVSLGGTYARLFETQAKHYR
jgi:ATP-binding cassette, subfamily B, bacterial